MTIEDYHADEGDGLDPHRLIDWNEGCRILVGVDTKGTFYNIIKRAAQMGIAIYSEANSPSPGAPQYYRLSDIIKARQAFSKAGKGAGESAA